MKSILMSYQTSFFGTIAIAFGVYLLSEGHGAEGGSLLAVGCGLLRARDHTAALDTGEKAG